jgi:hypothetical protein
MFVEQISENPPFGIPERAPWHELGIHVPIVVMDSGLDASHRPE